MHAYVDESLRVQKCLYVVAAACIRPADEPATIEALKRLVPGRASRLHWRMERDGLRFRMIDTLAALPVSCVLVRYQNDRTRWSERGRAQALKCLLWHAGQCEISRIVLESRGRAADAADKRTITQLQKSAFASPDLTFTFKLALEPLLWIADILAGAATAAWGDGDTRYLERLEIETTVLDAEP